MPTKITQIDDDEAGLTILRVEGDLLPEDARILERVGSEIRSSSGRRIRIDLADLDFLDSESAPFLRMLNERDGFEIDGIEIFLQAIINQAERDI